MLILNLKPAKWFTLKMKVRRDTRCKVSKEQKKTLDEVNSSEQVEYQGKECIGVFKGIG